MEQNISDNCYRVVTAGCDQTPKLGFGRFFGFSLLVHMVCVSSFMLIQRNMHVASSRSPPIEVEIHDMEMKKPESPPAAKMSPRIASKPAMSPKVAQVAPPQPVKERTSPKTATPLLAMPLQPAAASQDAAPVPAPPGPAVTSPPGPVTTGAVASGLAHSGLSVGGGGGTSNKIHDFSFGSGNGPSFLSRVDPNYPLVARRMGREGKVLLRLTLDERGKLLHVDVLENPGYGFADAAVEAVRKSRFQPARINERPVASRVRLSIRFALQTGE